MSAKFASTRDRGLQSLSATDRRVLDLLMDHDELGALIGFPVRADRLRFKPGAVSTVSVRRPGDGGPDTLGWLRVGGRAAQVKADNIRTKAAHQGETVTVHRRGELTIFHGPIATDPRLVKPLSALGELKADWQVLRYNPLRRLVVRAGDEVLRVTASPHASMSSLARRLAGHAPVVAPSRTARHGRLSWWPWFGIGDLSHHRDALAESAAYRAGSALAGMHRSRVAGVDLPQLNPADGLAAQVVDLSWVGDGLPERAALLSALLTRRLCRRAGEPDVLCHGDFSSDQVLVDETGDVRLIDFDRAATGPGAADLGSFAAVELLAGRVEPGRWHDGALLAPLLAGYAQVHRPPTDDDIGAWCAFGLFQRIWQPLRGLDPQWRDALSTRLDQIEGLL